MEPQDPLPPNGFYPVSLNLVGRTCVVIGERSDREAVEKVAALRAVDADVVWLDDPAAVRDEDVAGAYFVISTPQDEALSARLRELADRHKFLFCAIDQPQYGFVAMQAIVSAGPVKIAISTGGVAPRVGKILKEALQRALDARFVRFVEELAARKREGRATMPDRVDRRREIIAATDGFRVDISTTYPEWFTNVTPSLSRGPETLPSDDAAPQGTTSVEGPR